MGPILNFPMVPRNLWAQGGLGPEPTLVHALTHALVLSYCDIVIIINMYV